MIRPIVLIVPSRSAAIELPRRLAAATGRAIAGVRGFTPTDLARTIAEPVLLEHGLRPWTSAHAARLTMRLIADEWHSLLPPEAPSGPAARALGRTLFELRSTGVDPQAFARAVRHVGATVEDEARLRRLAGAYRSYDDALAGRFADERAILRMARHGIARASWLAKAEIFIVDALIAEPGEATFLAELARRYAIRRIDHALPPSLAKHSSALRTARRGTTTVIPSGTPLAPLLKAEEAFPAGLSRLRRDLFEAPPDQPLDEGSVLFLTAAGEAAEARAIVRELLRSAARGVPFEEMAILLPQADVYAPLFTDLLCRLGVPHRLHPSLPLSTGRVARSLLLLLRCRGLKRSDVLEFLAFAPIPFEELLGEGAVPRPALWDAISRRAGIVSEALRWIVGLRAFAAEQREAAEHMDSGERHSRLLRDATEAENLLRLVELIGATLDALDGEASWAEWASRLTQTLDQWVDRGRAPDESQERQKIQSLFGDLTALGLWEERVAWSEVESILETQLTRERLPLEPLATGAVHIGALDVLAGLPFRIVAIPGLVEGGFPGVLRPDPFFLDHERRLVSERLGKQTATGAKRHDEARQLSLFGQNENVGLPPREADDFKPLATMQDRLFDMRLAFHRAVRQASERLLLSYPRADARTGRERLPSLFFMAAASAIAGRSLRGDDLGRMVREDSNEIPPSETLDRSERDRMRVLDGGREMIREIDAGCVHFRNARRALQQRYSRRVTHYDGWIMGDSPFENLPARLDPTHATSPVSATTLADFTRCGFQYFLKHILKLEPQLEPEERLRIDPLERGRVFHEVAERFLRERRDRGELPLQNDPALRRRLGELADETLDRLVASQPPRFTLLWERERERVKRGCEQWLDREIAAADEAVPVFFELSFGMGKAATESDPHLAEPCDVPLDDRRTLRVSGRIDRVDRRRDGTLVLRDYKTGRAPRAGRPPRIGQQLQVAFYILAMRRMLPEDTVSESYLDFVDGGRRVAFEPQVAVDEGFRSFLKELVEIMRRGLFLQEPSACDRCDFNLVCGPISLIEHRNRLKERDPRARRVRALCETP